MCVLLIKVSIPKKSGNLSYAPRISWVGIEIIPYTLELSVYFFWMKNNIIFYQESFKFNMA